MSDLPFDTHEMNADPSIQAVRELTSPSEEVLDALYAHEKAHPRYDGGRKTVKDAIEERMGEITAASVREEGLEGPLRLITVPHSGTRFTKALLADYGVDFSTHHAWEEGFPRPFVSTGRIVTTVRDPVLVEISSLNRNRWVDFNLWARLEGWMGRKNVHFFRIDCPEDERESEIEALSEFLGAELHGEVDWSPKNTSNDRLGLKEAYRNGEIPPELRKIWTYLTESSDSERIQAMFRELGYRGLPWME